MNPKVTELLDQLAQPENTSIHLPELFNFGFDVIDYAAEHDDKTAFIEVSGDGNTQAEHSFSMLATRSNKAANCMQGLGLNTGDFVVVILPRIPEWYDVMIGCIKLGLVAMPGTNLLTARDIAFRINKAQAKAVVVTSEHVSKVDEIKQLCPSLTQLLVVGNEGANEGWVDYSTVANKASSKLDRSALEPSRADQLMLAYFTSGTTADPKLVARNHGYALTHAVTGSYWLDLKREDIHWTLSDTGWAKAAWGMFFAPWLMNSTMVLFNGTGFDPDLHLRLIKKLGVTTFCAPPTIFRMFSQMDLDAYDLSSIRHTVGAGEPLNPEVIRIWNKATGTTIYDGYGQTETINIVANAPGLPVKPGSMGKSVPGFDVQIVDDEGGIVKNDEIGHIALKITDPYPMGLFDGYYDGPNLRNQGSFRHGWYYTGDTATRDADGYIWFVGRSDDVISSAGYRISPFEVESALLEHPDIMESAVVGKPDEIRGHIVKAFVVLVAGKTGSDELTRHIQDFTKQTTAPYKYPREIEYRESLPKTISGKIRRVELRGEG